MIEEGFAIRPFRVEDQQAVQGLILLGLGEHFGQIDPQRNPDLADIEANYRQAGHAFFVADAAGQVIGTGGLLRESAVVGRIVRVSAQLYNHADEYDRLADVLHEFGEFF